MLAFSSIFLHQKYISQFILFIHPIPKILIFCVVFFLDFFIAKES